MRYLYFNIGTILIQVSLNIRLIIELKEPVLSIVWGRDGGRAKGTLHASACNFTAWGTTSSD